MAHLPVLLNEVIEILRPKQGEFFIDGTMGNAGHAVGILEKIGPQGKLLGVDWDKNAIERLKIERLSAKGGKNVILVNDNYANLPEILKRNNLPKADGLLLDLGISSEQLENSGCGFSFSARGGQANDEPLLMTYSLKEKPAYQWLEELKGFELAKIIKDFGEERYASRIARAIKKNLPIKTSRRLAEIVSESVPKNYERGRIHPATRTFQALRIFVNRELENLKDVLSKTTEILNPGGRLAVISFHSLEDRIVKNVFRELVKDSSAEILTKKPIRPSAEEILNNPRSRSAKLRALVIRNLNYDHN